MHARGIMADAGMVETGSCADDGVSFGCQSFLSSRGCEYCAIVCLAHLAMRTRIGNT